MIDCLKSINQLAVCAPYFIADSSLEIVLHFFCQCQKIQSSWHALCDAISSHITLPTLRPVIAVLAEWTKLEEKSILIYDMLLLPKNFLCHRRNEPERLHIVARKHQLKFVEKLEQKIAYFYHIFFSSRNVGNTCILNYIIITGMYHKS